MKLLAPLLAVLACAPLFAFAQQAPSSQEARPGRPPRDDVALTATKDPGIAWFGAFDDAVREAERTGKPILLFSAAPQCRAVPGMW